MFFQYYIDFFFIVYDWNYSINSDASILKSQLPSRIQGSARFSVILKIFEEIHTKIPTGFRTGEVAETHSQSNFA